LNSTWRIPPSSAETKNEAISTKLASAIFSSRVYNPASWMRGSLGMTTFRGVAAGDGRSDSSTSVACTLPIQALSAMAA